MNRIFVFLIAIITSLSSCKKESDKPKITPVANFDFVNIHSTNGTIYIVPTFVTITTVNNSTNATASSWNTNAGNKSSEKAPIFKFTKPGSYKITLHVKSETGDTTSVTKSITVVDRSLYAVKVTNPNWASGKTLNLFVRIYNPGSNNSVPVLVGDQYSSSIKYQSSNVSAIYNSLTPTSLDISNSAVLTPAKELLSNESNDLYINYGYCLYSLENGVEHLLASSWDNNNYPIFNDNLSLGISSLETTNHGLTATFFAYNNK